MKTDMNWRDRLVGLSTSQRVGFGLFAVTSFGFVVLTILVAVRR